MLRFGWKKIITALLIFLLLLSIPVFIFLFRSPVLIVTDDSFDRLYGPERLKQKKTQVSAELFRRVIPVPVAETAGEDLITIAVEEASKTPWIILFPYRYAAGANYYKDKHPEAHVFIIGGGERPKNETSMTFARTNSEEDMYRAGLCAAVLAGEGKVLFYGDGNASDYYWEAFRQGLKDQDHGENPLYLDVYSDFSTFSGIGCVVLAGSASKFLEKDQGIPIILFSWIDPVMTPRTVKVVFDDSPWALAAEIIRKFTSGEDEILVSSRPLVISGRIKEKSDSQKIQKIIKENLQKN